MTEPRITHHGKQIMLGGKHLADAIDPAAAEAITTFLNEAVLILPDEETLRKVKGFFA